MTKEQRWASTLKKTLHSIEHCEDREWFETTSAATVDPDWDQCDVSQEHTLLSGEPTFQPRR